MQIKKIKFKYKGLTFRIVVSDQLAEYYYQYDSLYPGKNYPLPTYNSINYIYPNILGVGPGNVNDLMRLWGKQIIEEHRLKLSYCDVLKYLRFMRF